MGIIEDIKESRKGVISIAIGIIVLGIFLSVVYAGWSGAPEEKQVIIDRTIENLSQKINLTVTQQAYLTNQFSESKSFGGAGGMGASVIGAENIDKFILIVQQNNLSNVYYVFEAGDDNLVKKYWAPAAQGIFELKQTYKVSNSNLYYVKSHNNEIVIFEKDFFMYWLLGGFASVLVAVIAWVIAYILLSIIGGIITVLSEAYSAIKYRSN